MCKHILIYTVADIDDDADDGNTWWWGIVQNCNSIGMLWYNIHWPVRKEYIIERSGIRVQWQSSKTRKRRREGERKAGENGWVKENTRCQYRKTREGRVKWHLFFSLSHYRDLNPAYDHLLYCTYIYIPINILIKRVGMSHANNSLSRDLKRAITMCKWTAPSPLLSSRGMH